MAKVKIGQVGKPEVEILSGLQLIMGDVQLFQDRQIMIKGDSLYLVIGCFYALM